VTPPPWPPTPRATPARSAGSAIAEETREGVAAVDNAADRATAEAREDTAETAEVTREGAATVEAEAEGRR
jgi:hypothetical protein